MKNFLCLLITFLGIVWTAAGQTADTTFYSITQENGPLEKQRFIDQYDYVFGTKQRTQLLVKLNLVPVVLPLGQDYVFDIYRNILENVNNTPKAELGLEWKVAPALSINASGILATRGSNYFKGRFRGAGWRIEPRWYYDMARRIRSGQSADNVSGNYISFDYQSFAQSDRDREPSTDFEDYRSQAVSLRYGLQRRLLRYGFIDLSVGAGYQEGSLESQYSTDRTERSIFFETRVAAGFAFGAPRTDKSQVPLCDVLRCFQEDRHLWKIGLAKALRVNQSGLLVQPKLSYEHKIGHSSISVETEAEVFWSSYRVFNQGFQTEKYGAGLNVQPRWYFLQKHRIAKGKSGNNLSGVFAGVIGGYRCTKQVAGYTSYGNPSNTFYVAPHLGIQQRLFKNGFVQYKFGVLYDDVFRGPSRGIPDPSSFLSELQVGIAF